MARSLLSSALVLALVACGGDGSSPPPTPVPPTPPTHVPPTPTPQAPVFTTQPASVSVPIGGSVTLTAATTGDAPIAYQWFRGWVPLYGATGSTLTLNPVNLSDGGAYKVIAVNGVGSATSVEATVTVAGTPQAADLAASAPRVVLAPKATSNVAKFPNADQSWQVTYTLVVPPVPTGFDELKDSFYAWGDVEFDAYGALGPYKLSGYKYNQVVPQLMIGNVVGGHTPTYGIIGKQFKTWVAQAQYFWQKDSTPYAYTGAIVAVNPGETVTETISYDATTKRLTAAITAPAGTSTITIDRPFLNEALFTDWKDFFTQSQAKSGPLYVAPILSIEPNTTKQVLCTVLPFTVSAASAPTLPTRDSFALLPVSLPCAAAPVKPQ